jgi:lipopolysaccharide/colanic/teichoic acid biosynthesis glycosyltransferase
MTLGQVPRAQKASWKTFGLLLYRIGLLLVWTVFSLPGVVLHAPIFVTASVVSKIKAKGNVLVSYLVSQVPMCLQRLSPRRS